MKQLTSRPRVRDTRVIDIEAGRSNALLDQYGKEIDRRPRRLVAAPNPRQMQTHNNHPAIGLTIENLISYFRSAEQGSPMRQMDVFDDLIERLAEMRGMFDERNDFVSGADFRVTPGRDDAPSRIAAEMLEEYLKYNVSIYVSSKTELPSTCFREWIEHQLTSVPYGYACTNMVWDYVENLLVPVRFEPIAHRRFGAPSSKANEIWLIDGLASGSSWIELESGLWSVTRMRHRNPYAGGLMRSCAWWALFALTGFKHWQVFADMFGLPLAIGYYEDAAHKESREALEDAVKMIGEDGYAVLSNLTELVIKETARGGDGSTVYPLIFESALQQIRKVITGGALNTDTGASGVGSYNAATVHESRAFQMKRRDATRIEDEFTSSIGTPFVVWNGMARAAPPRLKCSLTRDELARAQAIEILGMAMPISKSQVREEFNLREPSGAEDTIRFTPTEAPDPNRARPERKR